MAKNWGHYKELGVTIPDDLEPQDWVVYTVCAPDSVEWRTAVYSAVRLLSRGRFWKRDDRAESIKMAQAIGRDIEMSFSRCDIGEVVQVLTDSKDMLQLQLEQIRNAVSGISFCCEQTVAPFPDPVELNEGDPPTEYGDQAVTTWSEYEQYLCGAAHKWVNAIILAERNFTDIVEAGSLIIGGIAVVLSILAAPEIGLLVAVSYSTAAAIFTALLDFASGQTFDDVADFMTANEVPLANAIVCAGSPSAAAAAVRSYLEAGLTALEYEAVRWFDIEGDMQRLYAGVDKNGDPIEATLATDCFPCDLVYLGNYYLLPVPLEFYESQQGSGVTGDTYVENGDGSMDLMAVASGPDGHSQWALTIPPDAAPAGDLWVGFALQTSDHVNVDYARLATGNNVARRIYDGASHHDIPLGDTYYTKTDTPGQAFRDENPGLVFPTSGAPIADTICAPHPEGIIALGFTSAIGGDFGGTVKLYYIYLENYELCGQ